VIEGEEIYQRHVRRHFKFESLFWDETYKRTDLTSRILQVRRERVLEMTKQLSLANNAHVLEVGCGAGLTAVELARRRYTVEAVDTVKEMIDLTRHNATEANMSDKVSPSIGDAYNLQFHKNTFDLVVAIGLLDWLNSPRRAIREMTRVARPGSYLIITCGNYWRLNHMLDPFLNPLLSPVRGLAKRILAWFGSKISHDERTESDSAWGGRESPSQGPRSHKRSPKEVKALASSEGLELIKVVTVGFGPFSFFGKNILSDPFGVWLQEKLQQFAGRNFPALNRTGRDAIFLAKKTLPSVDLTAR